ncbi:FxsA family protein [Rhodococcus antarcticus]|uniref:FxsA family protein n=1 Tax=Rhodococcus antarcticus TaxID=2987751 RepID=A0ABY6P5H4_9NOCA|nr:FxsA family protein [Rhodococcus antarcticus]UZJ26333.1 FxsA family protein [Rhodococcus antarcticus]
MSRMPLIVLLVLFVVEVAALVAVGTWIGVGWTVLLFVGTSVLGGFLLRNQGRRTLAELREAQAAHRTGGKELADGALGGIGALLMVLPGLLTDVVGLLLVLPPTRTLVRPLLGAAVARTVLVVPQRFSAAGGGRFGAGRVVEGEVVEGEVVEGEVVEGEVVEGEVVDTDDPAGRGRGRTPLQRPTEP